MQHHAPEKAQENRIEKHGKKEVWAQRKPGPGPLSPYQNLQDVTSNPDKSQNKHL